MFGFYQITKGQTDCSFTEHVVFLLTLMIDTYQFCYRPINNIIWFFSNDKSDEYNIISRHGQPLALKLTEWTLFAVFETL